MKAYQDFHLHKSFLSPNNNFAGLSRRSSFSRQKTEDVTSCEPISKKRDTKKLNNLSYKLQKSQRSVKDKKAIEDLKQIGEISFSNIDRKLETSIKFNHQQEDSLLEPPF